MWVLSYCRLRRIHDAVGWMIDKDRSLTCKLQRSGPCYDEGGLTDIWNDSETGHRDNGGLT